MVRIFYLQVFKILTYKNGGEIQLLLRSLICKIGLKPKFFGFLHPRSTRLAGACQDSIAGQEDRAIQINLINLLNFLHLHGV
jgi:hypothetical protein